MDQVTVKAQCDFLSLLTIGGRRQGVGHYVPFRLAIAELVRMSFTGSHAATCSNLRVELADVAADEDSLITR